MNQISHFDFIRWKAVRQGLICAMIAGSLSSANLVVAQPSGLGDQASDQASQRQVYPGTWHSSADDPKPAISSSSDSRPTEIVETRYWQSPSSFEFPSGNSGPVGQPMSGPMGEPMTGSSSAAEVPPESKPNQSASSSSILTKVGTLVSTQFEKLFGHSAKTGNGPDIKRMLGALSLVLGGYFALIWLLRLLTPKSNQALPQEVIEVLGKTPFGKGQYLQLVRLGSKLLLLLESNEGIQPIAEVTDPEEVHQLLAQCDPFAKHKRRKRSSNARAIAPEPQVHSFRIPAVGQPESTKSSSRLVSDPQSPTLADLIRVIENATGKTEPKYRNSFEA